MTIANAKPDLLITGPIGTTTVNAASSAWHDYLTVEAKITAAIAYAVSIGAKYCYVPDSFLPYTASLVTFNPAVKMLREGGGQSSWFDIQAYGADPIGVLDATAATQAAINGAQALNTSYGGSNLKGGVVYVPPGVYVITSTLTVTGNNITVRGDGFAQSAAPTAPPSMLTMPSGSVLNFNLLTVTNTFCFQLLYIGLQGNSQGTSQGVFGTSCQNHVYDHVFFNGFGLSAINLSSIGDMMIGCFAQNCLKGTISVPTGIYDLASTDIQIFSSFAGNGIFGAGNIGNGNQYAFAIRNGNGSLYGCMGDQCHHGFYITGIQNRFVGCRAFQNQGNGFHLAAGSSGNSFTGCDVIGGGQSADNTYAGFRVTTGEHQFANCFIDGQSTDTRQHSNGFDDSSATGQGDTQINYYSCNRIGTQVRGVLYNMSGGIRHRVEHPHKITADQGDTGPTITWGVSGDTVMFQTPLTSARVCTLANNGTTLVPKGSRIRVVRSAAATGASTLTVTGGESKVLAVGQWVDFEYTDESQWREVAFGSL